MSSKPSPYPDTFLENTALGRRSGKAVRLGGNNGPKMAMKMDLLLSLERVTDTLMNESAEA